MALKEKQKNEWIQTLKDLKLIDEDDTILEHVAGDYWKAELLGKTQKRGNIFFTNQKLIFVSGFGLDNLAIPYSSINSIEKCNISLFLKTGIKVNVSEDDNVKSYILSVMKRDNWIEFLNSKCN